MTHTTFLTIFGRFVLRIDEILRASIHERDCRLCESLIDHGLKIGRHVFRLRDHCGPCLEFMANATSRADDHCDLIELSPSDGIEPINCIFAGYYRDHLRQTIRQFKYKGARHIAYDLGLLLAARIFAHCQSINDQEQRPDLIVAVQSHVNKERERGYNQADLMARIASLAMDPPMPYERRALIKTRATRAQHGLTKEERLANLDNAFAANRDICKGRNILLIDDVLTTGATARACALAMHRAGARSVTLLVVARAISVLGKHRRNTARLDLDLLPDLTLDIGFGVEPGIESSTIRKVDDHDGADHCFLFGEDGRCKQ